ncbi:MAG TPA: sulfate ABC transporter ATP-binding protein [Kiritimatiellia bacterium]|jgi:sulfate transport system ATP-binding protein|nr:MAG: Sulfate/thiosulfate import ATP-binding protein CysA [Verrucomicrobia bacterium ADurb.Bin070]HPO36404.1 sulfate ABC transporter ATP-binding protein [Kiritimatiellia bacterium]HQA37284.1 sulfate ABC transporter ATP-binding protein [Kiritimatiellia bacterium]HQL50138.1 sulfate ABC transporter ATP-binding protein [Kiritimatiellia bacterium]
MSISIHQVSKTFGAYTALDDISLEIPSGELTALLGPSGSGKTTLLRIVAGLETADPDGSGRILFDGAPVTESPVNRRRVGFVFQHYALFRHMTVFENIAFGLRVKPRGERPLRDEIRERVHALLKLVQLEQLAQRYPSQLSGGQRQRIALARALAIQPRVLLLDEPFGALDAQVRTELRRWLRHLHDTIHVTSIFVTHDQEEALEVADRIVVMNKGRIEQTGTPDEVFQNPASEFVMKFLGDVNVFHGRVHNERPVFTGDSSEDGSVRLLVRPHDLAVLPQPGPGISIPARVYRVMTAGALVKIELLDGQNRLVQVQVPHETYRTASVHAGQQVYLAPKESRLYGQSSERLEYVI